MKIEHRLGPVQLDLVYLHADGAWLEPVGYAVEDHDTYFRRMPQGQFGIQLITPNGADVQVYIDGRMRLDTTVPGKVQVIDADAAGKNFFFDAAGLLDEQEALPALSSSSISGPAVVGEKEAPAPAADLSTTAGVEPVQSKLRAPKGHGLVFVVFRLLQSADRQAERDGIEYAIAFQMNAPGEHERVLAGNLSRIVAPPVAVDLDLAEGEHPRITTHCLVTGATRKH